MLAPYGAGRAPVLVANRSEALDVETQIGDEFVEEEWTAVAS